MGDGGGQETTTTSDNAPWHYQQRYLRDLFGEAQGQFRSSQNWAQRYSGNRVAGLSENTMMGQQMGLDMMQGAGQGPTADYMQQLMSGQLLGGNPQMQSMMNQGAADITRQFQTAVAPGISMANIGRSGSGSEMNRAGQAYRGLGDALASNFSNTMGRNYQMERGYQQQGVGMMNQFDQNARQNIGFGQMMGQPMEQYQQRLMNNDISAFEYDQQARGRELDAYTRRIMGGGVIPGQSSSTSTTTGGQSGAMQGAGLGISALGALAMFCSRNWKDELDIMDPVKALNALEAIKIPIWRYTKEFIEHQEKSGRAPDPATHVGPYAEDFAAVLGLGDGKTISHIDIAGMSMAAVKGAGIQLKEMATLVAGLLDRVNELECVTGGPSHLKEVPA